MTARKKTSSLKWLLILTIALFSTTGFNWWWSEEESDNSNTKEPEKTSVSEKVKKPEPEKKITKKTEPKKVTQKKGNKVKKLKPGNKPTGKVSKLPSTEKPFTPPTAPPSSLPAKITTKPTTPPINKTRAIPSAPIKSYAPVTAQGLRGVQTPAIRPKIAEKIPSIKDKNKKIPLEKLPVELSEDASNMIGQAYFPDGSKLFIVYDDQNNPTKILNINPKGKKTVKLIGSDRKVHSIKTDGSDLSVEYKPTENGTQVIFKNQQGTVIQKKYFNNNGLLTKETDKTGNDYIYKYLFENGSPKTFEKIDSNGKTVKNGACSDNDDLKISSLTFQTKPSVKAYTYKYDDNGNVKFIIENKGSSEEIVRELNSDGKLVSVYNKKTGIKYLYKYGSDGLISEVTILSPDGSKKTIKRGDNQFDMLINEFPDFDPIAMSESIRMHQKALEYSRENILNRQVQENMRLQKIHRQKDFTPPKTPVSANTVLPPKNNFQPKSVPTQPVKAPSVPKRY